MFSRPHWILTLCATALALVALMWRPAERYLAAADLLIEMADSSTQQWPEEVELELAGSRGKIRARLYLPAERPARRAVVVAHGVHYRGIDEKRLIPFARALARQGFAVLTPELGDVIDYRVTDLGVDIIAESVHYLAGQTLVPTLTSKVGVVGFSFAGGLALVAAARPALSQDVAYVVSIGGHHDLARVMRFLATDRVESPEGLHKLDAHEYGLVVAVYSLVEHFVPETDRAMTQDTLRFWLREDRQNARRLATQLKSPEAQELILRLEAGRLGEFKEQLLLLFQEHEQEFERLSPRGKFQQISAPIYLLHGSQDTVIPPVEARWAELELAKPELAGHKHQVLISPLLQHVGVSSSEGALDRISLVNFMVHLF